MAQCSYDVDENESYNQPSLGGDFVNHIECFDLSIDCTESVCEDASLHDFGNRAK